VIIWSENQTSAGHAFRADGGCAVGFLVFRAAG
jgi:hypothetical protein